MTYLIKRHPFQSVCITLSYDIYRKYFNFTMLVTDLILFRSNLFTMLFIAMPSYLIFTGINVRELYDITNENTFCTENRSLGKIFAAIMGAVPIIFPFIFSAYM